MEKRNSLMPVLKMRLALDEANWFARASCPSIKNNALAHWTTNPADLAVLFIFHSFQNFYKTKHDHSRYKDGHVRDGLAPCAHVGKAPPGE